MTDEQFLAEITKELPTTGDESDQEHSEKSEQELQNEEEDGEAEEEDGLDDGEEGESEQLDIMKQDSDNIFDKDDSEVDEYMEQLEDDELAQPKLRMPDNVDDEDYGDYGDEGSGSGDGEDDDYQFEKD